MANRLMFSAEGDAEGTVNKALLDATVTSPEKEGAIYEMAKAAGKMTAALGMGPIPEAADTAIRASRSAKGTSPGTGHTWAVTRVNDGKGYSLIFTIKRPGA